MELSRSEVKKIANLARLDLTDKELKIYGNQLSDVLSYIDQIKEVDTTNVEPTAQVTGLENVLREDRIEDWDQNEREAALKQAPEMENGQVKVKRILD